MSGEELRREAVFGQVKSKALRLRDLGEILSLSCRQAKRLWRRYRLEGAAGL
jgi:hypothetical protein